MAAGDLFVYVEITGQITSDALIASVGAILCVHTNTLKSFKSECMPVILSTVANDEPYLPHSTVELSHANCRLSSEHLGNVR